MLTSGDIISVVPQRAHAHHGRQKRLCPFRYLGFAESAQVAHGLLRPRVWGAVCLLLLLFISGSKFLGRVHLISPTPAEMFCAMNYTKNMAIVELTLYSIWNIWAWTCDTKGVRMWPIINIWQNEKLLTVADGVELIFLIIYGKVRCGKINWGLKSWMKLSCRNFHLNGDFLSAFKSHFLAASIHRTE